MFAHFLKAGRRFITYAAVSAVVLLVSAAPAQSPPPPTIVDCTGTMGPYWPTTNVFSTLNQYLQVIGPVGAVQIFGTCHENVTIWNGDEFTMIGPAEIVGNVSIGNSPNAIFLRSLTITNPNGDGVDISGSKVSFNSCDVSNNAGNGVSIDNASHVVVVGNGTFDNNGGAAGVRLAGHSFLNIAPSTGPVEIRGNSQSGIWATQADIQTTGNTIISDSVNGPGVELLGGSRAQFGSAVGMPNVIENNLNGGIEVRENSELSFWTCCSSPANVVTKNGMFGISAGFHSQVTLSGANITANTGPGVNVYSNSQLSFFPNSVNEVDGNGSAADATSAGVRIDGNSTAWLRGGEISNNLGPGIRVGLNSSADFSHVTLVGNAGIITCDFTSPVAADISVSFTTGCIEVRRNP